MLSRFVDPFFELNRLQNDLARNADLPRSAAWAPTVDITEGPEAITVHAELPGIAPDDVKIDLENNVLTLRGERRIEKKKDEGTAHRVERFYGSFSRQFLLPRTVDAEKIEADLKDGVLTVRLPKRTEVKPRQIAVNAKS
jgi:HSP20 family protein